MQKALFLVMLVLSCTMIATAQNHSGLKASATVNDTKLKLGGDEQYNHFSEGLAWELGYSFHIPLIKKLSLQLEPALGRLPMKYSDEVPQVIKDDGDKWSSYVSLNALVNAHVVKQWYIQGGPRVEQLLGGYRKSKTNFELTIGATKHLKWLDVYARYSHGLTDTYGSVFVHWHEVNGGTSAGALLPQTTGYSRRFEVGVIVPIFKMLKSK